MTSSGFRIGIDVGGTFTHGVLLSAQGELQRSVKTHTTHQAESGVAQGVAICIGELIKGIDPSQIQSVNHSTTQATNAMLEGDLSPVRVFLLHGPGEGFIVRRQFAFSKLILSPYARIDVSFSYHGKDSPQLPESISEPILIAQTLTQDEPLEDRIYKKWVSTVADASKGALIQTATSLSRLLGLKARVKTAIINCAMLPTMLKTLNYMERALDSAGLQVPLMVIKSDGGVMPKEVVFQKPITCLLSGPAAGAGAGIHSAGISTGLFLDVGGTSTDVSFIYRGKVGMRSASVGGHRLQVQTLDLRTIALGGGSLIGANKAGKILVGPRSAHLVGLAYLSFLSASLLARGKLRTLHEKRAGVTYYTWEMPGVTAGFTLTDFANLLGAIPRSDEAHCDKDKLAPPFNELLRLRNEPRERFDVAVRREIVSRFLPVYREYLRLFRPERRFIRLVGGGGGVYSALPFIAESIKLPFEVCQNYPVISAIGAGLSASTAVIRIASESASPEDIERARTLASRELHNAGVLPEKAHFEFNFDSSAKILTVTASASKPFESLGKLKDSAELRNRAVDVVGDTSLQSIFENDTFVVFRTTAIGRHLAKRHYVTVIDRLGRLRIIESAQAEIKVDGGKELMQMIHELYHVKKTIGDAGEQAPRLWVVAPTSLYNLTTLTDANSAVKVLSPEDFSGSEYLIILLPA